MGVDATLFAKNSKIGFNFDRYWKLRTFETVSEEYQKLMKRLEDKEDGNHKDFTQNEINYIINTNLEIFKTKRYETYWLLCLKKFVNDLYPNDLYFCATDHDIKANFDYENDDGYKILEDSLIDWEEFKKNWSEK